MFGFTRSSLILLSSVSFLALAACDDAETRAEKHYESGLELVSQGDTDRAIVEFRNVFKLNPNHAPAREAFGDLLLERGDAKAAMREYRMASELETGDDGLHFKVAEIGLGLGDWAVVERHVALLSDAARSEPRALALAEIVAYRNAVEAEDDDARLRAATRLAELAGQVEDPTMAQKALLDAAVRDGDMNRALELSDALVAADPTDRATREIRLRVLAQFEDTDAVIEELEAMVELFPEDDRYLTPLLQMYVREDRADQAETYLRDRIATAENPDAARLLLVTFLKEVRGNDVALAATTEFLADGTGTLRMRAVQAALRYEMGDTDAALAEMEAVVADAEADETSDLAGQFRVSLAKMLVGTGDAVAARQKVEEALAEDPSNVEAAKMKAAFLIEGDQVDEAILLLRTALDNAPRDPEIMALMADAHLRNGARGLAGEMLALASETSGNRPREALRYARFLLSDGEVATAESLLVNSLRVQPGEVEVLGLLGQIYISTEDWARAEQIEDTLERLETEPSGKLAATLRIARLKAQQRGDEALAFLEELAGEADTAIAAKVAIARTHVERGDFAEAETFLETARQETPDDPALILLQATVYANTDRLDAAQKLLRDYLGANPKSEPMWRALHQLHYQGGDPEGASQVLDEALAALPGSANLRWARAGELEQAGDFEGAIGVYEDLYDELPNSPIIANNLASLITTYRDNAEDLERAYQVARRLKGSELPAFQDTYGWIAFRRGEVEEAVTSLESAATGLPGDPIVQYHLAKALEAVGRTAEALDQYRKAVDIAGPGDTRSQIEEAREKVAELSGGAVSEGGSASQGAVPSGAPGSGTDAPAASGADGQAAPVEEGAAGTPAGN